MTTPFQRSYWVAANKFLAGAYPGSLNPPDASEKLSALLTAGVTRVISLMEESEKNRDGKAFINYKPMLTQRALERNQPLECLGFPIVDGSVPEAKTMEAVLDTIDDAINANGTVYVHCWGGRGRTGTVVCCWLIRHGIASPELAVDHVQKLIGEKLSFFHPTPENQIQKAFVRNWCPGIRKGRFATISNFISGNGHQAEPIGGKHQSQLRANAGSWDSGKGRPRQ
jgi:hypothetical protein